jgi:ribosomal protein S18 acetylase RimI-like enzyme
MATPQEKVSPRWLWRSAGIAFERFAMIACNPYQGEPCENNYQADQSMIEIEFNSGELSASDQQTVTAGFTRHNESRSAPHYKKERLSWIAYADGHKLVGAITTDILWDWMYIDELWVDDTRRGQGLGKKLMLQAEEYAESQNLTGLWLWTQSWQAAEFYQRLGYAEFARFPDFPRGHSRIGFRKILAV